MVNIAMDIDGTLANPHALFIDELKTRYRIQIPIDDLTGFDWGEKLAGILPREDAAKLFWSQWEFKSDLIPLMDDSVIAVLQRLQDLGHTVDAVTANRYEKEVRRWVARNRIPHNNLVFSPTKHILGYDIFVDDHPKLVEKLRHPTIQLLYNRPWNRKAVEGKMLRRIGSFEDIEKYVNQ